MSITIRSAALVLVAAGLAAATAACSTDVQDIEGTGEEAVNVGLPSFAGYWARGAGADTQDRVPTGEFVSLQLDALQGASGGKFEAFYGTCQRIGRGGACLGGPEGKVRQGSYGITRLRDRDGTTKLTLTETGSGEKTVYTIRAAATAAVVGQPKAIELVKDGTSQLLTESRVPGRCEILPPRCGQGQRELAPGQVATGFSQFSNCAGTVYCGPAPTPQPPPAACKRPIALPGFCTANFDPVCGCDGKTYSNECVANNQVTSSTYGACATLGDTCGDGVFGTPRITCEAGLICKRPSTGTAPTGPSGSSSALTGKCARP